MYNCLGLITATTELSVWGLHRHNTEAVNLIDQLQSMIEDSKIQQKTNAMQVTIDSFLIKK